jgi:outer membrane protein assembly factor BamC
VKKSFGVIVATAAMLGGCGLFGDTFRDRSDDYQLAEETAPIQVPADLDSNGFGEIYPIPAITDDTLVPGKFVAPRPQRASAVSFEQQVKIQKLGDESWALVQTDPSQTWPRVRNVLNRNGIPAAYMDAPKGIMETVWVEFKDDPDNSYRYRFKIEPGVQLNSTEISVLENHALKSQQAEAVWVEPSMDPEREVEMLTLIAETLAGDLDSGSVSLLAQSIGGEPKVDVLDPKDGHPYMTIKLAMDRAWASVGYSSERGGFTTVDKDRTKGIYYVNFEDPETEEQGFFSKLFFGSDDIQLVDDTGDYQIVVAEEADGVKVTILNRNGKKLERYNALYLLKILRSNLS